MNEEHKLNFSLLGSKAQYDKLFEEILQLPQTLKPHEITQEIRTKLSLVIFMSQKLDYENVENFTFYRIRVQKVNEKPIDDTNLKSFSYPPDDIQIGAGRANLVNEKVFYACGDSHTPFHELAKDIKLGTSIVYLSKWGIKPIPSNIYMRSLFLGIDDTKKDSYASIMAKGVNAKYLELCKGLSPELQDIFLYYQKRYTELFTFPGDNLYYISSAIAHEAFYNPRTDDYDSPIILYPSVAKNKDSVNFAFRKDFVDTYLYLKEVEKLIVTDIGEDSNSYTPLQLGKPKDNRIEWQNISTKISKIDYENSLVSYSLKGEPLHFKKLQSNENLTSCCRQHSYTVAEFMNRNNLTPENIANALHSVPKNLEFHKSQKLEYYLITETTGDVFVDSEVLEKRRVTYLNLPITYTVGYE